MQRGGEERGDRVGANRWREAPKPFVPAGIFFRSRRRQREELAFQYGGRAAGAARQRACFRVDGVSDCVREHSDCMESVTV